MPWSEFRAVLGRLETDAAGAVLLDLGAAGLQEDHLPGEAPSPTQPWENRPPSPPPERVLLRAFFENADREWIEEALRARLGAPLAGATEWADVPEADWANAWQDRFHPFQATDRLVVAPPWEAPPGALVIEPGLGFGTGLHPTTRQALRALDRLADGARTVLDVGCGSGILALAAAKLGAFSRGIDVEDGAIANARANAAANALSVEFSTDPLSTVGGPFDLVLANIHAEALVALSGDLARVTARHLVLAGILEDRESLVAEVFAPSFATRSRETDEGWVCLVLERAERTP